MYNDFNTITQAQFNEYLNYLEDFNTRLADDCNEKCNYEFEEDKIALQNILEVLRGELTVIKN